MSTATSRDRARDTILRDGSAIRILRGAAAGRARARGLPAGTRARIAPDALRRHGERPRRPGASLGDAGAAGRLLARRRDGHRRPDHRARQLRPRRTRPGGGRVHRGRRLPGPRHRDAAARGAGRAGAGSGHLHVLRGCPRRERPDAPGLPRERLPDAPARRAGLGPRRVPDGADGTGSRSVRTARAERGCRRRAGPPLPRLGGRGRGLAPPRDHRRRALPQPAERGLHRPGLPREPECRCRPVGGGLPLDR